MGNKNASAETKHHHVTKLEHYQYIRLKNTSATPTRKTSTRTAVHALAFTPIFPVLFRLKLELKFYFSSILFSSLKSIKWHSTQALYVETASK